MGAVTDAGSELFALNRLTQLHLKVLRCAAGAPLDRKAVQVREGGRGGGGRWGGRRCLLVLCVV